MTSPCYSFDAVWLKLVIFQIVPVESVWAASIPFVLYMIESEEIAGMPLAGWPYLGPDRESDTGVGCVGNVRQVLRV